MNPHPFNHPLLVSFVHGYHDDAIVNVKEEAPALWDLSGEKPRAHSYRFAFDTADFENLPYPIVGELPRANKTLSYRPRFGFTGLVQVGDTLFAGSWNGIYALSAHDNSVSRFITNRFTCYLHRFYADHQHIIFVMPFKDLVVIMNHDGTVEKALEIDRSLRVKRVAPDVPMDWRFENKPWSGPTGYFHINHVQKMDDRLLLTSRNLGAMIELDLENDRCSLRTLNYKTTSCIHDGDFHDGRYYFTSIDGKVIIASEPQEGYAEYFNYDLQATHHSMGEVENNWCRGIAVTPERVYVTLDGRYGSDLSFQVAELNHEMMILHREKFKWSNVGSESLIRYVTGFDILALS